LADYLLKPSSNIHPMLVPASFNLDAVKRQIQETIRLHEGD
jgi:hypothetical protein